MLSNGGEGDAHLTTNQHNYDVIGPVIHWTSVLYHTKTNFGSI